MTGSRVRRALLVLLAALLLAPALRAAGAETGAVILLYHRFGEDRYPATNIRLEQFEAQLAALAAGPYQVLPLPDIVAALAHDRPLPDHALAITIDDAFLSVYSEAWPRLRAAGLPVTLFVATEPLDDRLPDFMSWDQLREMLASDLVTLGGHSVGHGHMVTQSAAENEREIEAANDRFRDQLGQEPTLFSYPYGEFDLGLRDLVADGGFAAAFGQQSGVAGRTSDLYALPRFSLNEAYGDSARFQLIVNALPLPVTEVTPRDPVIGPAHNPPTFGFTVLEQAGSLSRLACYYDGEPLTLIQPAARRIEVRLTQALPPGRSRINCTLPGPDGRWRWYGRQFTLP